MSLIRLCQLRGLVALRLRVSLWGGRHGRRQCSERYRHETRSSDFSLSCFLGNVRNGMSFRVQGAGFRFRRPAAKCDSHSANVAAGAGYRHEVGDTLWRNSDCRDSGGNLFDGPAHSGRVHGGLGEDGRYWHRPGTRHRPSPTRFPPQPKAAVIAAAIGSSTDFVPTICSVRPTYGQ